MKILMHKQLGTLRPVDDAGRDSMAKIGNGEIVSVEVKRPRNVQHHRLYWALLSIVHENLEDDRYATVEDLHAAVKIAAGLRTHIELPDGTVGYIPGSIAFHKMGQDEFSKFYDRVCDLIAKHFLPGVKSETLKAEVSLMIGVPVQNPESASDKAAAVVSGVSAAAVDEMPEIPAHLDRRRA